MVNCKTFNTLLRWGAVSLALFLGAAVQANDLTDLAGAHLAAGEFGAAQELAAQADPEAKQAILQKLIHAQLQADMPNNAQAVMPQLGTGEAGQGARAQVARQQMLNGGTGADFTALIDLIQNETEGPWFEIDGVGGTMDEFESGIRVDPKGVLSVEERSGQLSRQSSQARIASLNEDMAKPAALRLVSLTRLEQEVARRIANGQPVVESMRQLAGLSQIQYVFVYENDLVIGGPAEGWQYDARGMAHGVQSGRPTLHLDDLVTVMRTFSDEGTRIFGCSIDPKPENIQAVKDYAAASQAKGALSPAGVRGWANRIGQILGMQDVTVYGVPANSRVARVLVEADYRMKLIGVGKLDGGSNVPSYFELLSQQPALASGGLDAMRWWMTMNYDEVLHSANRDAFQIRGPAVKCQSENQFLAADGKRVNTGKAEPINQAFAANFTAHYGELAQQDPIFADLQGIFDLALVAALIDRDQLAERVNWDGGVFAPQGAYETATYPVPRNVDTVIAHKVFNGKDVVLQAAGGVRADLLNVVNSSEIRKPNAELAVVADSSKAAELPVGRWWWDAK